MYCILGLSKALAEKVLKPNGGWVDECDYDLFCSPVEGNEGVHAYVVGFFMPDGKRFIIDQVSDDVNEARWHLNHMNGGSY